jgi:hypothetical protein
MPPDNPSPRRGAAHGLPRALHGAPAWAAPLFGSGAADQKAAQGWDISAIIKGIAGVAEIVLGIPPTASLGTGGMGLPEGAATGGLY